MFNHKTLENSKQKIEELKKLKIYKLKQGLKH